ncbi:MAG: hemolysin III family protein [Bacillota bacterium]
MQLSKKEEIWNAITHGVGAVVSIPALVLLIVFAIQRGSSWRVVTFTVFGVTMLLLYLCSTLLHSSFNNRKLQDVFEVLDHSAIYLLIAGTYTPFMLITVGGVLGWTIFGIVWGMALFGIVFKIFFVKRFKLLSTLMYLAMGWLIVIALKTLYLNLSFNGVLLLALGGISYSVGTIFYMAKWKYAHTVWHGFVLGGSAMMYLCVLLYV